MVRCGVWVVVSVAMYHLDSSWLDGLLYVALQRGIGATALRTHAKHRSHDVEHCRDEQHDGENQHGDEHLLLIFVARGPEVDQDDADAVECVEEQGRDERQRDDPYDASAEDGDGVVV